MIESIGDRIKRLRNDLQPRLTQRELAERAGVSVDLVSKLEQGARQTPSIASLHKIARALGVDAGELVSRGASRPATSGLDAGIPAIRQAVTMLDELVGLEGDAEPLDSEAIAASVTYAWGSYWSGRYDLLAEALPTLVRSARAVARDARNGHVAPVHGLLAESYQIAACLSVHLGYADLAHIALERGLAAADMSEDPLRRASLFGSLSWLLLNQGRLSESRHVAVTEADNVEPRMSRARPEEISVWGNLLVTGATATARDGQDEEAVDLLSVAGAAAARLGEQRNDYNSLFGPAQVVMQSVDVAVVGAHFGRALDLAQTMPRDVAFPVAARARHMADVAYAQTHLGRYGAAENTLLLIERTAPDWMRYQSLPRSLVRELRQRERRRSRLNALARRLDVID